MRDPGGLGFEIGHVGEGGAEFLRRFGQVNRAEEMAIDRCEPRFLRAGGEEKGDRNIRAEAFAQGGGDIALGDEVRI